MDDLQIIELFFERNELALKETDAKYGKLCFGVAKNILHNKEDSEECVNETYLSMWNTIPPTRPVRLVAYICKIVRNLALKKYDYTYAERRSPNMMVSLGELIEVLPDNRIMEGIQEKEIGEAISRFLKTENESARNVFIRKCWFFDSIKEISDQYSFSESKVKSMLHHTRKRLKKYLEEEGIRI